ncbi:hypothetical protein CK203_110129 [Vitis vinifera]|uniref:Retrotransposon gag domain-containing protein n=1 Tax=Vitis vinifera TaxID=29760 RepID=A0A438CRA7_VITVI|nr:hypothetical protein CK203_110129 [Vitis vinifera]
MHEPCREKELGTSRWKPTSQPCEDSLVLRNNFASPLGCLRNFAAPFFSCEMIPEASRINLKHLGVTWANTWRHLLVISCELLTGNPRFKDHLEWLRLSERLKPLQVASVINFVDYFLNQGAPAEHESAETPIGHDQMAPLPGNECQVYSDTIIEHFCCWILVVYAQVDTRHGGRLIKCDTPQRGEFEVILNIMEATPEDQHSHQGRQDNLNEFRSMRDRMHPPRMRAPSCIVPPTEQLVIRPYLVPLLPTFHGMESENPYAHIKEFEDVCNTFQEGGASIDLMRLKLFPFTLKDKAKIWLNSLRPRSIRSWTDLQAEFLKKFFPTHRTNGLKRQISNFSAKENEKFYECWERYMEAINACPHHGFDTWLLVSYFYDGMSSSMKQLLETMCGGDFMSKNPEEAMDFLSYVADVSRGWDEPTKGEVGKMKSQLNAYNAKAGIASEAVSQLSIIEHLVEECPAISAEREMYRDQANVVGQFRPNNNAPYGNTYNSSWRNHPNFSWKARATQYQQPDPPSQQSSSIEQAIANLSKGRFPSQPHQNPKGVHEVESQEGESSQVKDVKALITLRSGKKIEQPTPKPHVEKEEEIKKGKEMEDKESEISEEKRTLIQQ